ncbi:MAG: hypothetical protein RL088_1089 [Verrucomicrobiota bacterium]|jgi:hypothetical protein
MPELVQPPNNSLRPLAALRTVEFEAMTPEQRTMIEAAFARAEVGLCGYKARFSVVQHSKEPFVIEDHSVSLCGNAFIHPALLRFTLRHAIEELLWRNHAAGATIPQSALRTLAAFAARRFFLLTPTQDRETISHLLPAWLDASPCADEAALASIAKHFSCGDVPSLAIVKQHLAVANPTEFTFTLQGDERLLIDPSTGLNKYGCSPKPRPEAITFSSCTASSVSEFAYAEGELLRQRFMAAISGRGPQDCFEAEIERVRSDIAKLLGFEQAHTHVFLSTSGTDAELYPLALFRSTSQTRLVNIVVAPDEVGSGTVLAAGGRHFCSVTPRGTAVKQGSPVEGIDVDGIEVILIPIRRKDSTNLSPDEIHAAIEKAVGEAEARADRIILHVVDNTKTGVVVPEVSFVSALKERHREKLRVLVDACQFRLERVNLQRYLAHGFAILITGSKFFTGPPFSGALLLPPDFGVTAEGADFPAGFAEYFTFDEVPPSLRGRAVQLPRTLNFGLLFRWTGALAEMRAYFSVPQPQRTRILSSFRHELVASIRANRDLELLTPAVPVRWNDADQSLWDALPTIFSFAVRSNASEEWLGIKDLRAIYQALNRDCSASLPSSATDAERALAAQRCHIGQPVVTSRSADGRESGALRIACGARLVYGISFDSQLGASPEERFTRELTDARTVLTKISLIVKYWRSFSGAA